MRCHRNDGVRVCPLASPRTIRIHPTGVANLMMHYYADEPIRIKLAILINLENRDIAFQLPEGRTWGRVVDTQAWFDIGDSTVSPAGLPATPPQIQPYPPTLPIRSRSPKPNMVRRSIVILKRSTVNKLLVVLMCFFSSSSWAAEGDVGGYLRS